MNLKKEFRFPGQAVQLYRSGVSTSAPWLDQLSGSNTAQKPPRILFSTLKGSSAFSNRSVRDERKEVDKAKISYPVTKFSCS